MTLPGFLDFFNGATHSLSELQSAVRGEMDYLLNYVTALPRYLPAYALRRGLEAILREGDQYSTDGKLALYLSGLQWTLAGEGLVDFQPELLRRLSRSIPSLSVTNREPSALCPGPHKYKQP
jgi:hypothetical protein